MQQIKRFECKFRAGSLTWPLIIKDTTIEFACMAKSSRYDWSGVKQVWHQIPFQQMFLLMQSNWNIPDKYQRVQNLLLMLQAVQSVEHLESHRSYKKLPSKLGSSIHFDYQTIESFTMPTYFRFFALNSS